MAQKPIVQALAAALALGLVSSAEASGFQLLEQNASGLGNAYAGSAVIGENASTVFYNPAAMTKLSGGNFSAGLSILKPSYKFKNDGSSDGSAALGSQGGDAGGWAALPNLYGTWQLSERWVAGIGVGSPFGLKTEYDNDWIGRFQSSTFDIKTYNVNPSLAVKASDSVSVGFGLNYQRMEAMYQRQAATVAPSYQATTLTMLPMSWWTVTGNNASFSSGGADSFFSDASTKRAPVKAPAAMTITATAAVKARFMRIMRFLRLAFITSLVRPQRSPGSS